MDSNELKSIQAPLKTKYKEQPESALITLKAEGKIGEGITCNVDTGRMLAQAGLHPATGGTGMQLCSGDMLLQALVACAGVTLASVATAIDFKLDDATLKAEGDIDFRGTLAVAKEVEVGFKNIRLSFHLVTKEPQEKIDTLLKLTERYCVVYQTITKGVKVDVSVVKGSI
jgi:uncharacterized OsmC-like protein